MYLPGEGKRTKPELSNKHVGEGKEMIPLHVRKSLKLPLTSKDRREMVKRGGEKRSSSRRKKGTSMVREIGVQALTHGTHRDYFTHQGGHFGVTRGG